MERKLRAVVLLEIHLLFVFFLHGQSSADNENGKLTHRVTGVMDCLFYCFDRTLLNYNFKCELICSQSVEL